MSMGHSVCREEAVRCLELYFSEHSFHSGGPIPKKQLFSDKSVSLLMESDFCQGIEACYKVLTEKNVDDPQCDITFMLKKMEELNRMEIARQFHPGIILIYLRYCLGYTWPNDILEITLLPKKKELETLDIEEDPEFEDEQLITNLMGARS